MPLWIAALTMTATWVDGGYLLGTTEGVYKSSLQLGVQGGPVLRSQPDPRRPVLRRHDAALRFHDAYRSARGALRGALGRRAVPAGAGRRAVLERGAAGGDRRHLRRAARHAAYDGDPARRRRHHRLHHGRRHVVGGLYRHRAARAGGRSAWPWRCPTCSTAPAAWRTRCERYAAARPESLAVLPPLAPRSTQWQGRAVFGGGTRRSCWCSAASPGTRTSSACCRAARRRDAARHSVLAGVLTIALTVPPLLMGIGAFAYPWDAAATARLAATPADALPLLLARAVPPAVGTPGPGGHHRGRHVELQFVDPVGRRDAELERRQGLAVAGPVGRRRSDGRFAPQSCSSAAQPSRWP